MNFDIDNIYCGAIKRGDILILENEKNEKPVLVLQDDMLNQGLSTVLCAPIEPHKKGDEVFVNEVLLKEEETGLGCDGICFLHKISTIDRRAVVAKKGELSDTRLQEAYHALDITLGRFRD